MPAIDRKAQRHATTRREVLDVAWRLSAERGLTGWSLTDLASGVGMRAPSLYVYFSSKSAVYDALFADGYRQMEAAADLVDGSGTPLDLLRRVAHFFVGFCAEDPARYQLLFLRTIPGFEPSPTSYAGAQAILDRSRDVLVAAGAVRRKDLDLWTALLTGLASQQISNDPGGQRWTRLVDDAVDMFVATRIADPVRRKG
ncbi:MAG: TetR/AcrR family transcriptional regulator [Candidatus Nanopelagicales bacterium]